ncbi:MAG: hypothetical protein Q8K60_04000 [Parachlamydiaceae bacterium]|nr:hypothetical protein [Parachlamydiaceae bacterium]
MRANEKKNNPYHPYEYPNTSNENKKVSTAETVYSEKDSKELKNRVSTAEQMQPHVNIYASKVSGATTSGLQYSSTMSSVTFSGNLSRNSNAPNNNNRDVSLDFNKLNKKKNKIHESPE